MGVEENLALCYADLGRKKEAIALLEQVRDRRERLRGPSDARTLATIGNLATVYQDDDRVKDAVTLFERIVKAKLESADFGAEHPSTIAAQNNLAAAYLKDGRAAEVITLLQAVRTASTKALGAEHPETLKTLNNLAESLLQNHKADEAIAILKSVSDVQLASREFGPRHGDTARTLNNLAKAYVDAKRDYKTAIPIFEQARDALKGGIGVETIEFQLLNNLAEAYTTVRRIPDALRTYEELVGMAKANPEIGPAHVTTRDLLSSWTQMLLESGKFAEAVQPLRDLIAAEKRSPTPNRKLLASATVQLGNTLLNLGQAADAEAPLRESLAIRLEIQPKDWTTHNTRSLLGESLLKQKKLEEAGRELRQGYDNLIKVEILANYRTLRLGQALDRLIQHAEATNDANAKAKWQAEKAALSK
jgi:tetratricopeptide (TPR) repeat protein